MGPHRQMMNRDYPESFTVVSMLTVEVMQMEDEILRHHMTTRTFDRPDVSVGLRWAKYRREELRFPETAAVAPLYLPNQDITVELKVYPLTEIGAFRKWFFQVYLPDNYLQYLDNKPEFRRFGVLPRASCADNTSGLIAGRPAQLPLLRRQALSAHNGFAPALPPGQRPQLPPA